MNTQQTRGPWKVLENGRGNGRICVTTANGAPVHAVICEIDIKSVGTDYLKRLANAQLIAAAPDLLAALEVCAELLATIPNDTACAVAASHARAAIAKAEGNK
jgi:hypothetical protein